MIMLGLIRGMPKSTVRVDTLCSFLQVDDVACGCNGGSKGAVYPIARLAVSDERLTEIRSAGSSPADAAIEDQSYPAST